MNTRMKRLTTTFVSVALLGLVCACGGDEGGDTVRNDGPFVGVSAQNLSQASAEARSAELVSGEVISSRLESRDGYEVYEVYVVAADGALLSIEIHATTGEIVEVEQEDGGPTADLQLPEGFVSAAEAVAQARLAAPGEVLWWELELDDDGDWEYDVYILADDGTFFEVEVDARTGEVTEVDASDDGASDDDEVSPIRDGTTSVSIDDVRAVALSIVDGTVDEVELNTDDDYRVWEVEIRRASGATIEIELLDPSLAVVSADGDEGPFDYAFDPGSEFLTLAEAIDRVSTNSSLESWELDRNSGGFEWELEFDDGTSVEIDAFTGAILD